MRCSSTPRRAPVAVLAAALGLALATALPAAPTAANGTPIKIVLSYLVGVSSWGPTNATGVGELVLDEGEVRLTATGLPQLAGEQYWLWIINTRTGDRVGLGAFKVAEGGVAKADWVLSEPIPDKNWDLMLVSVEAESADPTAPSARHSIAGRFPPPPGAEGRPGQLPATGGEEPARSWLLSSGTLAIAGLLGLLVSAAIGFGLGRLTAKRRPH